MLRNVALYLYFRKVQNSLTKHLQQYPNAETVCDENMWKDLKSTGRNNLNGCDDYCNHYNGVSDTKLVLGTKVISCNVNVLTSGFPK